MVTQVSLTNRDMIQQQGYSPLQFHGFDSEQIPLYAHTPKGDKKVGDVVTTFSVKDRRHLKDYEAVHLAGKGAQGLFPWRPGEECLTHTFQDVKRIPDKSGGARVERGEPYKGCKWCRASLNNGSLDGAVLEGEPSSLSSEPSRDMAAGDSSAAPVQTAASYEDAAPRFIADAVIEAVKQPTHKFQCPLCEGGASTETGFKLHITLKHTSKPHKATPKRAGRKKIDVRNNGSSE